MKKTIQLTLLLITLLSFSSNKALAYDIAVENEGVTIYYNYSSDGKELSVTRNGYGSYSGTVVIPDEVTYMNKTYKVTSIGESAFSGCSLTSITIPNSVTSIGNSAFNGCRHLTSINIPNSVTSIGNSAFYDCRSLTSINIPNSVTNIGESAFQDCRSLTSVTIPNSVTNIGDWAFFGCIGLTSISFHCKEIDCGFIWLPIKEVILGDEVEKIGNHAFEGCGDLTSVTIPNSVTSIGSGAFYDCGSLTSVIIGNSVTSIGESAFYRCQNLTSVTIGNSVTSIGNSAFYDCRSLTSINIPNSVTSIGNEAFWNCRSLTSVHITDLSAWCNIFFDGFFSNPLPYAHHLFLNGEEIRDLVIPNNIEILRDYAFAGCTGLTSITIPETVNEMSQSAISGCSNIISARLFAKKFRIDGYENSFGLPCLEELVVGNGTSIGEAAFAGHTKLKTVIFADSDTKRWIDSRSFQNCPNLTNVTIGNGIIGIGTEAFGGCSNLTSVTIGNSVTSIGYDAFYGCSSLTSVISEMNNPCSIEEHCFSDNVYNNTPLYVPMGTIEKYKSTDYWHRFLHIVEGSPFEHTLTYSVDGEIYSTYTLEEGDIITPEESPTKEGYTFSGWSDIPATMPANDVTVTGTFTVNKYTITYVVDGVTLTTEEVEYGTTITPPTSQKDGYEISWNAHPTTMPAYGITIYGSYISTGIENYSRETTTDNRYFNLNGQRIEGQPSQKGVYIKNGKKVLMK